MQKIPLGSTKILVALGLKLNAKIEKPKYRHDSLQQKRQREQNLKASCQSFKNFGVEDFIQP